MKKNSTLLTVSAEKKQNIKFDYHIHSCFSDGQQTLLDCVKQARKIGLAQIAFTDHVWRTSEWIDEYVGQINKLQETFPDIRIYAGAEAKALNRRGDIDIREKDALKLDFVTAAVHRKLPEETLPQFRDLRDITPMDAVKLEREIIESLVHNPLVDVIAHPMRLYYKFHFQSSGSIYPLEETGKILKAVLKAGKLVELNHRIPNFHDVLKAYFDSGVSFVLTSDAHHYKDIGDIPFEKVFNYG
jgi:putative hydrolase